MKIFSVSKNDWAGCGYFLSQAINEHTEHHSRAYRKAPSRFSFPYDLTGLTGQRLRLLWNWADVIHIHDVAGFEVVKMPPKPVVITFHGTKYRNNPEAYHKLARHYGWLATVATPDLTRFGLPWLPDTRPDLSHLYNPADEFTVCHAPSKRDVKGTQRVIAACKQAGVKLDLIENVPWEECIARKAKCHLLIDQFELGYGCNAIEAWSLGTPVIADGTPDALQAIITQFDYLPFSTQPFYNMVRDRDWRADWAETGRVHYLHWHSPWKVAEWAVDFYLRAIQEWRGRKQLKVNRRRIASGWGKGTKVVLLEYKGGNVGSSRWFPEGGTGTRYKFDGKDRRRYVHEDDVPWFLEQRDRKDKSLFEVVND